MIDITENFNTLIEDLNKENKEFLYENEFKFSSIFSLAEYKDERTDIFKDLNKLQNIDDLEKNLKRKFTSEDYQGLSNEMIKRLIKLIDGKPLHYSFYEFIYLHFDNDYEDEIFKFLVNIFKLNIFHFFSFMNKIGIRNFDEITSTFSYMIKEEFMPSNKETMELGNKILSEKFNNKILKQKKNKLKKTKFEEDDILCCKINLMMYFNSLILEVTKDVNHYNYPLINDLINLLIKMIYILELNNEYNNKHDENFDYDNFFTPKMNQYILIQNNINTSDFKEIKFNNILVKFKIIINEIDTLFVKIKHNYLDIKNIFSEFYIFSKQTLNALVRGILGHLCLNLGKDYLVKVPLDDLLFRSIPGFKEIVEKLSNSKFSDQINIYITKSKEFIYSLFTKLIFNNGKKLKNLKYSIQEFVYLIHMSNDLEEKLGNEQKLLKFNKIPKDFYFMVFSCNIGIFIMKTYIELVKENDLIKNIEYPYFYLFSANLYHSSVNNGYRKLKKLEDSFQYAFTNDHSLKEHMDDISDVEKVEMFELLQDLIYHSIFEYHYKILFILFHYKIIKIKNNNDPVIEKNFINKKLNEFGLAMFVKTVKYESKDEIFEEFLSNKKDYIMTIELLIKESNKIIADSIKREIYSEEEINKLNLLKKLNIKNCWFIIKFWKNIENINENSKISFNFSQDFDLFWEFKFN